MDFDDVLQDIGEYDRYQKLMLCFVLLPGILPCGFHAYNQLFMSLIPQHWCLVPELLNHNYTTDLRKKLSIPLKESLVSRDGSAATARSSSSDKMIHHHYSRCHMYDVNYTKLLMDSGQSETVAATAAPPGMTFRFDGHLFQADNVVKLPWIPNASWPVVPCQNGWEYQLEKPASSVVSNWNLVCKRDLFVPMSLSIFAFGGLIGNFIFGHLQDCIGHRPSFFIFLLIMSVFGTATAFAPDFATWIVLRFFNGLAVPAVIGTPYVLAIELVGPSRRTQVSIITNIVYSLILVLLSVVVYLVREWHQLALATTVPFVAFFLYWWVLPESPRWLLANGKFEEMEKIIRTIAHVNRRSLPSDYMATIKRRFQVEISVKGRENASSKIYGFADLFHTPNIRKKTIIITFIWFVTCCVYIGLSYFAPMLYGDQYFTFFMTAIIELPSYIFLWPSMEYWGRRWTLCWSLVLSGLACLATMFVKEDGLAMMTLFLVGKFGVSSAFTVLPLMASELYPRVVRGLGLNFSTFVSMTGPIVIPFVNYLGQEMLALPLLCMGSLLLVAGICSLSLPETLNQRLPYTLSDGEEMDKDLTTFNWLQCCPPKHTFINEPSVQEDDDVISEDRSESPLRSLLEQQGILQSSLTSDGEGTTSSEEKSSKKTVMVTAL